jgi:2'-5' RNA ligase
MPSLRGQSAVVIPVAAAEPVAGAWRERYDTSALQGMPAHITVLYPFLGAARLTAEVIERLRDLCVGVPVLDLRFPRTARFPDVLYLEPEPADDLRDLTAAIAAHWPEAPPYGGAFDGVVPHLTVAYGDDDALAEVEADILRRLPVQARLKEAALWVFDGAGWQPRASLPFGCCRAGSA